MVNWEVDPRRRAAFSGVVALMVASLAMVEFVDFRVGGYCLAATLLLGGALRAFLPAQLCLGLLVRSRRIDVSMMVGLGLAVAAVVWRVPGTV